MFIFLSSLVIFSLLIIAFFAYVYGRGAILNFRRRRIKKRDSKIRDYLKDFSGDNKLAIIDETPREVFIGDRFYMLKPLKYRQYTRLCVLFSKMLQKLSDEGIDYTNTTPVIGDTMEVLEDEYFKAISLILYFSNNENISDEKSIFIGMHKEYEYLKKHATLEQVVRVLEVIQMQNDIERALKAFGLFGKKKIAQSRE